jgi:hypothetical protein
MRSDMLISPPRSAHKEHVAAATRKSLPVNPAGLPLVSISEGITSKNEEAREPVTAGLRAHQKAYVMQTLPYSTPISQLTDRFAPGDGIKPIPGKSPKQERRGERVTLRKAVADYIADLRPMAQEKPIMINVSEIQTYRVWKLSLEYFKGKPGITAHAVNNTPFWFSDPDEMAMFEKFITIRQDRRGFSINRELIITVAPAPLGSRLVAVHPCDLKSLAHYAGIDLAQLEYADLKPIIERFIHKRTHPDLLGCISALRKFARAAKFQRGIVSDSEWSAVGGSGYEQGQELRFVPTRFAPNDPVVVLPGYDEWRKQYALTRRVVDGDHAVVQWYCEVLRDYLVRGANGEVVYVPERFLAPFEDFGKYLPVPTILLTEEAPAVVAPMMPAEAVREPELMQVDEFEPTPHIVTWSHTYTVPEKWRHLPASTLDMVFAAIDRVTDAALGVAALELSSTQWTAFTRTLDRTISEGLQLHRDLIDTPPAAKLNPEAQAARDAHRENMKDRNARFVTLLQLWAGITTNTQFDILHDWNGGYRYALTPDRDVSSPIQTDGLIIERYIGKTWVSRTAYSPADVVAIRADLQAQYDANAAANVSERWKKGSKRSANPVIERDPDPAQVADRQQRVAEKIAEANAQVGAAIFDTLEHLNATRKPFPGANATGAKEIAAHVQ